MKNSTIKKWVIGKKSKRENLKFIAKLVHANLEDYESDKVMVRCCYDGSDEEVLIKKEWLYEYEEAVIRSKEFTVKVNFKNKKRLPDGTWQCSCCKRIIKDEDEVTIDHIKPRAYFRDKEGKYYSQEHWEQCWSESNLDITCSACNLSKGNLPYHRSSDIHKKANQHKKYLRFAKGRLKNKPGYHVSMKDEDALAIARRDSNYIDVDAFFRKNSKKKKKH